MRHFKARTSSTPLMFHLEVMLATKHSMHADSELDLMRCLLNVASPLPSLTPCARVSGPFVHPAVVIQSNLLLYFHPNVACFVIACSHGLGVDTPVQIGRDLESESVGNMWGTRIVLHSKALPPFLAPLASAVAMAGHDVSLMRKARALIDSTPRDAFEGVERAANG